MVNKVLSLTLLALLSLCANLDLANGSKILMITVLPSRSHHNLNTPVADTLAKRGHEVTLISPFSRKNSPCKKEIAIPKIVEYKDKNDLMGFGMTNMSLIEMIQMMGDWQPTIAQYFNENAEVKSLLSDKSQKFDLLIVEYFGTEYLYGLSVKYDCPVVVISPLNMINSLAKAIGNPYSVATMPNAFLGYTQRMTLIQRVENFVMNIVQEAMDVFFMDPIQKTLYERYFPVEAKLVPYDEVRQRPSLVLMNTHPSIGVPRPLMPNVIEIGGYHVNDPEPLPEDLREIMDSAPHGVIYFSLGSVLKGSEIDAGTKAALLRAFAKRKETVLWKFEESMPEKSSNVVVRKWMPQNSILAHPKLKVFVTHAGLLSCTEAAHFGVPLVTIPVFGDQPHNANMVKESGRGVVVAFKNLTEESLEWALNEVLSNEEYTTNAQRTKKLYEDRPAKPRDLIGYWVEHVIRTKGARHLSPPRISRLSHLLLDVYALILAPALLLFYVSLVACRRLCRRQAKPGDKITGEAKKRN